MVVLTIKNMVCRHCIAKVEHILAHDLHLPVASVELGYAKINGVLDEDVMDRVSKALEADGFELIQSREAEMVDRIKRLLIEASRRDGSDDRVSVSELLTDRLCASYATLGRIFSAVEGRSIENYYLNLRIERVKELIKYGQLSLSEIAYRTGFSSVAHLSRQFKQFTGFTPTQFRKLGSRTPLPEL